MRILTFHNLPSGGAKRALFEWIHRLSRVHTVDVHTLSTADRGFLDLHPFSRAYHVHDFVPHRLFTSPLGRLNQLQYWRNLVDLDTIASQMGETIDWRQYDVAFLNPCMYTFMPALARYAQVPAVYYLHEPFGPTFKRHIERPYQSGATIRSIARRISLLRLAYNCRLEAVRRIGISRVALLLANSEYTRKQIQEAYGVSAVVCRYGVNPEAFRPLPGMNKQNALISVGAMTPRKGFDFLIESLAEIPAAVRPALRIASNGSTSEEVAYIRALAAKSDVRLQMLWNLDTEELCVEYNQARLCIYSPVMEPFGLVPLEAMACGTPVVAVAEGGVRESVVHGVTGLLTKRDPKLFAEAIRELLADPHRLRAYGVQARDYVLRNWSWDTSATELESHLRQAASVA